MTFDEFQQSAKGSAAAPPAGLGDALQALWFDAQGDWDKAHEHAQNDHTRAGSWVHAYLHRKEGDVSNAGYWYTRAARPLAEGSSGEEWQAIARELLQ
jgi:hypothetical protein